MDAKPSAAEMRFAKRRTSKTPATIGHPTIGQGLNCTVRDSSSTGALIEIAPIKGTGAHILDRLPKRFTLTIPLERIAFECELMWQKEKTIGVRYVGPARMLAKPERARPRTEQPKGLMEMVLNKAGIKTS